MTAQNPKTNSNKPLEELKKLNKEVSTLRRELTELHSEVKSLKNLDFTKQITSGILSASLIMSLLGFVLLIFVELLG